MKSPDTAAAILSVFLILGLTAVAQSGNNQMNDFAKTHPEMSLVPIGHYCQQTSGSVSFMDTNLQLLKEAGAITEAMTDKNCGTITWKGHLVVGGNGTKMVPIGTRSFFNGHPSPNSQIPLTVYKDVYFKDSAVGTILRKINAIVLCGVGPQYYEKCYPRHGEDVTVSSWHNE